MVVSKPYVDLEFRPGPKTARSSARNRGYRCVYVIVSDYGPIKIGVSDDVEKRLSQIQDGSFATLQIYDYWWLVDSKIAMRLERSAHDHFAERRVRGEWFSVPPEDAALAIEEIIKADNLPAVHHAEWERRHNLRQRELTKPRREARD